MMKFQFFRKIYIRRIRFYSFFLAVFLCLASSGAAAFSASSSSPDIEDTVIPLDITAKAALIVGTGRAMTLYHSNESITANYPAASKLMTAVIALETLTLDTQVTISNDAEALDKLSKNPLHLSKGEKCSVKYLVTAIISLDSNAAAFSLAEYISSDEKSFVGKMNEMAKALNMKNTLYANTSGKAVVPLFSNNSNLDSYSSYALQYSTISDLTLLVRYALQRPEFLDLFSKFKTLMFQADGAPQTLTSTMSAAWGLNPQLVGAARFECPDNGASFCVIAVAAVDDFEIAIVLGGSQDDSVFQDLYNSINTIFSAYEVSDLVVAGDAYRQVSISGIPEPLEAKFETTVSYIHPVGNDFIKPNTEFIPSDSVSLPISVGQVLGQVRFELNDGTQIDTTIVAAESMLTRSNFLSDTYTLLEANPNLSVIIGISFFFFLASVVRSVYILVRRIRTGNPGRQIKSGKQP